MPTTTPTPDWLPSQRLRHALVTKGYRREATRYLKPEHDHVQRFDWYRKWAQVAILQMIEDRDSREELGCELYLTVCGSNSLADTIAAIP